MIVRRRLRGDAARRARTVCVARCWVVVGFFGMGGFETIWAAEFQAAEGDAVFEPAAWQTGLPQLRKDGLLVVGHCTVWAACGWTASSWLAWWPTLSMARGQCARSAFETFGGCSGVQA